MEIFLYNSEDVVPSYGTSRSAEPRLRNVRYGDGYEEVAADGINPNPLMFEVMFAQRRSAEAADIVAFLDARAGYDAFIWVPPAPYNTKVRAWRCKKWTHSAEEWDSETVSATFEEVFTASIPALSPVPEAFQLPASDGLTQAGTTLYSGGVPAIGPVENTEDYDSTPGYYFRYHIIHTDTPLEEDFVLDETTGELWDNEAEYLLGAASNDWTIVYLGVFHAHYRCAKFRYVYCRDNDAYFDLPA